MVIVYSMLLGRATVVFCKGVAMCRSSSAHAIITQWSSSCRAVVEQLSSIEPRRVSDATPCSTEWRILRLSVALDELDEQISLFADAPRPFHVTGRLGLSNGATIASTTPTIVRIAEQPHILLQRKYYDALVRPIWTQTRKEYDTKGGDLTPRCLQSSLQDRQP